MGRYVQESVIIRRFDELDVVILDKQTIWILPKKASTNIIYHRWFSPPLGSWENWRRFRFMLVRNKRITLEYVYSIGAHYGIESMGTTRSPNLEGRKVVEK